MGRIDNFTDFWRPQLMILGYDSIFKRRTCIRETRYEGVVIAYKRVQFTLFKSVPIEFNDVAANYNDRGASFKDRCLSDDVGIIAFLQPVENVVDDMENESPSTALCVGCAMLCDSPVNADIRLVESLYFCRQIELVNKDFQCPVLLGVNLNDGPASASYHLFRTGRTPLLGGVPKKCNPPNAVPTCPGSVRLTWYPPPMSAADPPIISYRVAWRPGGSLVLGYSAQIELSFSDCMQYKETIADNGSRQYIALEELSHIISGLTSDLPYEFKIVALNRLGEGVWSDPCHPIVIPNAAKAPRQPPLLYLKTLPQLVETREREVMYQSDWDINVRDFLRLYVSLIDCFSSRKLSLQLPLIPLQI